MEKHIPKKAESRFENGQEPFKVGALGTRFLLIIAGLVALLVASGFAANSLRSCLRELRERPAVETRTSIYRYAESLSHHGFLILASRQSAFVIPREFSQKLIMGLTSTAKVQIACQATIHYGIHLDSLEDFQSQWRGRELRIAAREPVSLRPIIETSSIRQAILDRGFAFNERAELESLLAELSDLVASSEGAALDQRILDECGRGLEALVRQALTDSSRHPSAVIVEWRAQTKP